VSKMAVRGDDGRESGEEAGGRADQSDMRWPGRGRVWRHDGDEERGKGREGQEQSAEQIRNQMRWRDSPNQNTQRTERRNEDRWCERVCCKIGHCNPTTQSRNQHSLTKRTSKKGYEHSPRTTVTRHAFVSSESAAGMDGRQEETHSYPYPPTRSDSPDTQSHRLRIGRTSLQRRLDPAQHKRVNIPRISLFTRSKGTERGKDGRTDLFRYDIANSNSERRRYGQREADPSIVHHSASVLVRFSQYNLSTNFTGTNSPISQALLSLCVYVLILERLALCTRTSSSQKCRTFRDPVRSAVGSFARPVLRSFGRAQMKGSVCVCTLRSQAKGYEGGKQSERMNEVVTSE
jgi:hypothetical protein